MTTEQKRKTLARIAQLQDDIDALHTARMEVAKTGYASVSWSSSNGSKSFSRVDISKLTEIISALSQELNQLRAMLGGGGTPWRNVLVVYS